MVEQRGARVPEVAHLVPIAKHLAQAGGVGGHGRVLMAIAVGDTVAYAGHADGLLSQG